MQKIFATFLATVLFASGICPVLSAHAAGMEMNMVKNVSTSLNEMTMSCCNMDSVKNDAKLLSNQILAYSHSKSIEKLSLSTHEKHIKQDYPEKLSKATGYRVRLE